MHIEKGNRNFSFYPQPSFAVPLYSAQINVGYTLGRLKLKPVGIRRFYFDNLQHEFIAFIEGGRKDPYYLRKIQQGHLDTSSLAHEKLKNYLDVLTGFDSNGNFIAVPDINRNRDFTDDSTYIYKHLTTNRRGSLAQIEAACPIQQITLQGWDHEKVRSFTRFIRLRPWIYRTYSKINPPTSTIDSTKISADPYQHWEGNLTANQRNYVIYLYNDRPQLRWGPPSDIELAVGNNGDKDTGTFDETHLYGNYHLNDTISIGNEQFVPIAYATTGDSLKLKYVGKTNGKLGNRPGQMAREIKTADLHGNPFNLSALRGHYVLLDFWFMGCVACKATVPGIKKLNELYRQKGLKIASIALPVGLSDLPDYVSKNHMDWIHLIDHSSAEAQSITDLYRIGPYPTFILIDPKGKILMRELATDGLEKISNYLTRAMADN